LSAQPAGSSCWLNLGEAGSFTADNASLYFILSGAKSQLQLILGGYGKSWLSLRYLTIDLFQFLLLPA
jgi:hypothetical protein